MEGGDPNPPFSAVSDGQHSHGLAVMLSNLGKSFGDSEADERCLQKLRALLPRLLQEHLSPDAVTQDGIAVINVLSSTIRRQTAVFRHGQPREVVPYIVVLFRLILQPVYAPLHEHLLQCLAGLAVLMQGVDVQSFRHLFDDCVELLEDLCDAEAVLKHKLRHSQSQQQQQQLSCSDANGTGLFLACLSRSRQHFSCLGGERAPRPTASRRPPGSASRIQRGKHTFPCCFLGVRDDAMLAGEAPRCAECTSQAGSCDELGDVLADVSDFPRLSLAIGSLARLLARLATGLGGMGQFLTNIAAQAQRAVIRAFHLECVEGQAVPLMQALLALTESTGVDLAQYQPLMTLTLGLLDSCTGTDDGGEGEGRRLLRTDDLDALVARMLQLLFAAVPASHPLCAPFGRALLQRAPKNLHETRSPALTVVLCQCLRELLASRPDLRLYTPLLVPHVPVRQSSARQCLIECIQVCFTDDESLWERKPRKESSETALTTAADSLAVRVLAVACERAQLSAPLDMGIEGTGSSQQPSGTGGGGMGGPFGRRRRARSALPSSGNTSGVQGKRQRAAPVEVPTHIQASQDLADKRWSIDNRLFGRLVDMGASMLAPFLRPPSQEAEHMDAEGVHGGSNNSDGGHMTLAELARLDIAVRVFLPICSETRYQLKVPLQDRDGDQEEEDEGHDQMEGGDDPFLNLRELIRGKLLAWLGHWLQRTGDAMAAATAPVEGSSSSVATVSSLVGEDILLMLAKLLGAALRHVPTHAVAPLRLDLFALIAVPWQKQYLDRRDSDNVEGGALASACLCLLARLPPFDLTRENELMWTALLGDRAEGEPMDVVGAQASVTGVAARRAAIIALPVFVARLSAGGSAGGQQRSRARQALHYLSALAQLTLTCEDSLLPDVAVAAGALVCLYGHSGTVCELVDSESQPGDDKALNSGDFSHMIVQRILSVDGAMGPQQQQQPHQAAGVDIQSGGGMSAASLRVYCPCCDGGMQTADSGADSRISMSQVEPFLRILESGKPDAARVHMAAQLFRMLRHVREEELQSNSPADGERSERTGRSRPGGNRRASLGRMSLSQQGEGDNDDDHGIFGTQGYTSHLSGSLTKNRAAQLVLNTLVDDSKPVRDVASHFVGLLLDGGNRKPVRARTREKRRRVPPPSAAPDTVGVALHLFLPAEVREAAAGDKATRHSKAEQAHLAIKVLCVALNSKKDETEALQEIHDEDILESVLLALGSLASRCSGDARAHLLWILLDLTMHPAITLRGVSYNQVRRVARAAGLGTGQLLRQHDRYLFPIVIAEACNTPGLVWELCESLLGVAPRDFVLGELPHVMPQLIAEQREDVIQACAEIVGDTAGGLVLLHVHRVLPSLLMECMSFHEIPHTLAFLNRLLQEEVPYTISRLVDVARDHTILELVWTMGGDEERLSILRAAGDRGRELVSSGREAVAAKAVQALWIVQEATGADASEEEGQEKRLQQQQLQLSEEEGARDDERLAGFLHEHILYLFDDLTPHIVQRRRRGGGVAKARAALRSVGAVVELIAPRLNTFVSKTLATLRMAMQDPPLRSVACDVWSTFCRSLPDQHLGEHVRQVVVSLLPYAQPQQELPHNRSKKKQHLLASSSSRQWSGSCNGYDHEQEEGRAEEVAAKVCRTLHELLVGRGAALEPYLHLVPPLPATGLLRSIARSVARRAAELTLEERLEQLVQATAHGTSSVREHALRQMQQELRTHASAINAAGLDGGKMARAVTRVVAALLVRCSDSSSDVVSSASRCIGELGAVDPGLLAVNVRGGGQNSTVSEASAGGASGGVTSAQGRGWAALRALSGDGDLLATYLIEKVLLTALRAAVDVKSQDRALFAVQELLRYCGCSVAHRTLELAAEAKGSLEQLRNLEYFDTAGLSTSEKGQRRAALRGAENWLALTPSSRQMALPCLFSQYVITDSSASSSKINTTQNQEQKPEQQVQSRPTESVTVTPEKGTRRSTRKSSRKAVRRSPRVRQAAQLAVTTSTASSSLSSSPLSSVPLAPPPVFYKRTKSFRQWLAEWTRHLIARATDKCAPIFRACRGVVKSDSQTALQLLPYLVDNALNYGSGEDMHQIQTEILAVLQGSRDSTANSCTSSSSSGREGYPGSGVKGVAISCGNGLQASQLSAQAVFELIDLLSRWVAEAEQATQLQRSGSRRQRQQQQQQQPQPIQPEGARSPAEKRAVLDTIPKIALAEASLRCRAYTRALQYFELHVRQRQRQQQLDKDEQQRQQQQRSSGSQPEQSRRGRSAKGGGADSSTEGALSRRFDSRGIGAGLSARELTFLQDAYAGVDEPDGMCGLAKLRGATATLPERVRDAQSQGEWSEALTACEQALQLEPHNPDFHFGLLECLCNVGHLRMALDHVRGISALPQLSDAVPALSAYGVQAAWRLSRWDEVERLLGLHPKPCFEVGLAKALLSLHKRDSAAVKMHLDVARREIMGPLSAASWESYQRAYPYFVQLHMLAEVEQMQACYGEVPVNTSSPSASFGGGAGWSGSQPRLLQQRPPMGLSQPQQQPKGLQDLQTRWDERLSRAQCSLRVREPLISLRRVLQTAFGAHGDASKSWLRLAKEARAAGQLETAAGALLHATRLGAADTVVEHAKLLRARGRLHDALQRLEQWDVGVNGSLGSSGGADEGGNTSSSNSGSGGFSSFSARDGNAPLQAKIALLMGKWIQESGAKESKEVIAFFKRATFLQCKWEKAYFLLGKYYDTVLQAHQQSKQQDDVAARAAAAASGKKSSKSSHHHDYTHMTAKFLKVILSNYGFALTHGSLYIFQTLPRMLTLWFDNAELWKPETSGSSRRGGGEGSSSRSNFGECHNLMMDLVTAIKPYQWLTALPQIISRVCHTNERVREFIKEILVNVFLAFPQRTLWHLASVTRSADSQRNRLAREIMRAIQSRADRRTQRVIQMQAKLFDQLIKVCNFDSKRKRQIKISNKFPALHRLFRDKTGPALVVPLQNALTVTLPPKPAKLEQQQQGSALSHWRATPETEVCIQQFEDIIEVLKSKEKPRKITVRASDGRRYVFLCKKEERGDMRKNSRMTEFNTVINRLLKKNPEARKRNLRLRTFSVLPLTEECGLIEWVPHTTGYRHIIRRLQAYQGVTTDFQRISAWIDEAGPKVWPQVVLYRRLLAMYPSIFHKWFLQRFPEPSSWFESRLVYGRSAATWSMVGHVVGLGDRHGENLLVDEMNGEVVHVDFDCLFGKGLTLDRPERVPFRLTPNMVDALGVSGVEGLFRRSCETTMGVLREHRETLVSVLQTFVHDPLVEWNHIARGSSSSSSSSSSNAEEKKRQHARKILTDIESRLRGQENQDSLPLSVKGQIHQLIDQATSEENLAQMYIGWMPWM